MVMVMNMMVMKIQMMMMMINDDGDDDDDEYDDAQDDLATPSTQIAGVERYIWLNERYDPAPWCFYIQTCFASNRSCMIRILPV